jgi:hypothetical protein
MHRLGNHKHYVWKRGFSGRDQFTINVNLRVLQVICQLPIVCQNFGKTSQTLIQQIGFTSLIASLKTKETPRITIWRRYGHKRNQISSHAPISNQMFFFFFLFPSPLIPPRMFFFLFEMCGRSLRIAYSSSGRIHLYRIHIMPAEAPPTLEWSPPRTLRSDFTTYVIPRRHTGHHADSATPESAYLPVGLGSLRAWSRL